MKITTALLGPIALCLLQLAVSASSNKSSKRVIVSYKQSDGRSAITSSWTRMLEPTGVNLVRHNAVDKFAVLEGSKDDIDSAISSLPWIQEVEDDFTMKIFVSENCENHPTQKSAVAFHLLTMRERK